MAGADLGEPRRLRQFRQALLMCGVFPGVHQHDGARAHAVGHRLRERVPRGRLVQRFDRFAVHADAAADLHHPLVQQRGQADVEVEQAGAGLVADAQRIGEPAVDHEQRALPPALQQGVGGDGGAHLHGVDCARRDRRVRGKAEHAADAGDGGVPVALRVLAQQLVRAERTRRVARDDVGEGAAAIDPELPARHTHSPFQHDAQPPGCAQGRRQPAAMIGRGL